MVLVVVAIAIAIWLGGERFKNFVVEKRQARAIRRTERLVGGIALAARRGRQDEHNEQATHVLGGEDEDRTSLEDEDRPLLDPETGLPPLPPAYEDAVKPEDATSPNLPSEPARANP